MSLRDPWPEMRHDDRPEHPTLDELLREHDWHIEERADGQFLIDVCAQCGYETPAGRGRVPDSDCEVREMPERVPERVADVARKRAGAISEIERTDPEGANESEEAQA